MTPEAGWLAQEIFGNDCEQTPEEKRASILTKVRGLLNKASDPGISTAEAESYQTLANKLMTQYALDAWMLKTESREANRPEVRWLDYTWWSKSPFRDALARMFGQIARHCRCQVVHAKSDYSVDGWKMPVVGLPSDLDWFDLLFTNVMLTMIDKIDPKAQPSLSMEANMARMREAGMPWGPAINRLVSAGVIDGGFPEGEQQWRWDGRRQTKLLFTKRVYENTITAYRKWCAQTGHPQSHVSQATFRKHFADGFAAEIWERLYRMNEDIRRDYDAAHSSGSMELAVRDIRIVVQEMVWDTWPDLRPHPSNCDCDDCHRCHDANCQRRNCVAARDWKPTRTRMRASKEEKVNWEARAAGRAEGAKVNLSNKPDSRIGGSRGGLPNGQ
jgi:hypothetical protein